MLFAAVLPGGPCHPEGRNTDVRWAAVDRTRQRLKRPRLLIQSRWS